MHILINKIVFLVALTVLAGCSALQKPPSSKPGPQEPEETIKLPFVPLVQGKKPLLTEELAEKVDFPPKPKDEIAPCIGAKTGEETRFLLADLKSELIPLSYSNMDRVISSLEVMGLQTVQADVPTAQPYTVDARGRKSFLPRDKNIQKPKTTYACSDLPIFYKPTTIPVQSLTNVLKGPHPTTTGSRFSMVNMAAADYGLNDSLVAFYHPAGQKRYDNVRKTISKTLDAAPIQVYIESMVLEVNESGMDRLGLLYKNQTPGPDRQTKFNVGALNPISPSSIAGSDNLFAAGIAKGAGIASSDIVSQLLSVEIQAMIASGSAEVLSRPSVITINNRPAVIEVTEQKQFPVTSSSADQYGRLSLSYGFEEVTPGILLQIRPRVSDDKNEVAMEIDVQVKALVSANDGTAKDSSGNTMGTKPGSSTRRVHTFALVPNKTPIIIGGLVSKEREDTSNKVPGLSDIPFLGKLFGAESSSNTKKEVIVVITPHIIRNSNTIGIQTPKDTAMFDDSDMDLFRDSYRVRAEDVFDLGFVYQSTQFQKYRNYVVSRSARDEAFAKTTLAKSYSGAHFPGGNGLVARMIYDIVGKRDYADEVSRDRIIITEHAGDGNFKEVTFLEKEWQKAQSKKSYGLELRFSEKETDSSVQPHATVRMLPLAEITLLTETNKHHKDSSRIFIASEKDLKKIRRAIVVREIQKLNRSKHIFGHLNEFGPGTKFILPVIKKTRYFLLDSEVATVYHQIKFYYQILEESLRESFVLVEKEVKKENEASKRKTEELRLEEQLRKAEQLKRAEQLRKAEQLKRAEQLRKAEQLRRAQQLQRQAKPPTKAAPPAQPAKPPTSGKK